MIFFCMLLSLLILYLLFPNFVINYLHVIFQQFSDLKMIIFPTLQSQTGANSNIFDTVAQVLAAFLAIVFSISLFVIQISSEKYTHKIKKYFKENRWTTWTFGLGLFTILVCVLFLMLDLNNIYIKIVIFFLLILNCIFFYYYYNYMVEITNPYKIAELLEKECINSVNCQKIDEVEDIVTALTDILIKSIAKKDAALTLKYKRTLIGIYYEIQKIPLTPKIRIKIENIIFTEIFRALQFAIEKKDASRSYLISILFNSIQWEASKKEFVNDQEIDLIISKFLFEFSRYIIQNDDFELFKKEINHLSLLQVQNPRFIQEEIYTNLLEQMSTTILIHNQEISSKILKEINCFEFLLKYLTNKDFSSVKNLIKAYAIYEKRLEIYLRGISQSEEKIRELTKLYNTDRESVLKRIENGCNALIGGDKFDYFSNYKRLDLLFISLKLHFTFYCIGAFIVFKGKHEIINSALYLKELWDHTHPDDASGINLNETPVLFDPLWLTYLLLYGGQNIKYWIKMTFGFSLGFDDYHGAEDYLYQYYLLTITRCIQKGNSKLDLPQIEGLDNLKANEYYKLTEWYEFTQIFQSESKFLLDHCDTLIQNAKRWDFLFNNKAEEAIKITKAWVQAYTNYCGKIHEEINKWLNPDPKKIVYFSKKIIEEYRNVSIVNELAEITPFNEERDRELTFIHIYQDIGNLHKEWFFKEDYSHPDHIFTEFGRNIARGERRHILETILAEKSIEPIIITDFNLSSIFVEIKNQVNNMKSGGLQPSVVFIPLEIMKGFVIERMTATYGIIKIDDDTNLKVITSNNNWPFKEIVILDKSAGIWTFKPINANEERLFVNISKNESDELLMKILVHTTINYSIVKPDAMKILKFIASEDSPV
jgi:hypothetical protein